MMRTRTLFAAVGMLMLPAQPALAQQRAALAVGVIGQGYSYGSGFGVESTTLLMTPVAFTMPVNDKLTLDLYGAYARGAVNLADASHTMQGLIDTRIRASYAVTPWAVLSGSLNLPTGNSTHDNSEAIVATALSAELLGFREALWGTGFGFTTGLATAARFGNTGVGAGASYRVAREFEPSAEESFKYEPGNETRVRVAVDQNIGDNKLTLGVTFQNYSDDKVDGRNLFAPGNRFRGDVSYAFRTSPTSTWTVFLTDVVRENGDVTLRLVDTGGTIVGDSTFEAGQQNLAVAGVAGAMRLGSLTLRPTVDARVLTRESGEDEGWLASAGTEVATRRWGREIVPSARLSYGQLEGPRTDTKYGFWGGELGVMVRFGGGR
jgi:hypothetical protein